MSNSYLKRYRRLPPPAHADLVAAAAVAVAAVAAVAIDLGPFVRTVLALPLTLFVPGYVLQVALTAGNPLPLLEQLVVSIGASIALTILAGLVLAATPLGLTPLSWPLGLAVLTIGGAIAGWLRRRAANLPGPTFSRRPRTRLQDVIPLAVAGVAVLAIIVGTRALAAEQEAPPPEQLWLVPSSETLDARLGVRAGGSATSYVVRVTSAGVVLAEYELQLGAGEVWERTVLFSEEDRQRPIVARLFERGAELELRFVVLQPPVDGE